MLIGAIARPHGIKGDVQVVPFHAESPLWRPGTSLALAAKHKANQSTDTILLESPETLTIKRVSAGPKGRFIVWFDGLRGRSDAERHKGAWLAVAASALGELEEDEFWYHEVAGWSVTSTDGQALGQVVRIIDGPTDLLEVRPPLGGETYYIPMVSEFIVDVNRDDTCILVELIEGLVP